MAGHRRGAVVEHHDRTCAPGVPEMEKPGETRVRERGVADDGHHGTIGRARKLHTARHTDARPHTQAAVHRLQGRQRRESVAADVAGHHRVHLGQSVEDPAMRAAGTHQRRPWREVLRAFAGHRDVTPERAPNDHRRELAHPGQPGLHEVNAEGPQP